MRRKCQEIQKMACQVKQGRCWKKRLEYLREGKNYPTKKKERRMMSIIIFQ